MKKVTKAKPVKSKTTKPVAKTKNDNEVPYSPGTKNGVPYQKGDSSRKNELRQNGRIHNKTSVQEMNEYTDNKFGKGGGKVDNSFKGKRVGGKNKK